MSEPRLLVTGFPAFSDFESNISEKVLARLEDAGLPGIDVVTWLLSVDAVSYTHLTLPTTPYV